MGAASSLSLNPARLCNENAQGLALMLGNAALDWPYLRVCAADGMGRAEADGISDPTDGDIFYQNLGADRLDRAAIPVQGVRELAGESQPCGAGRRGRHRTVDA